MIRAEVILDSVSPDGSRLTTIEATFHRFVLAEFNTHRLFSRNSASSRAIPASKQIQQVRNNPAIPVRFTTEQSGMQGGAELEGHDAWQAKHEWLDAAESAADHAERLAEIGVHKGITNRVLEPFMWHTVIVTATDWEGFWEQRVSPLAQPEIDAVAAKMQEAYERSEPKLLGRDEWHTPYIQPEENAEFWNGAALFVDEEITGEELRKRVSAARCARVSYLTHDGKRNIGKDITLYNRLVSAKPAHWSPLEHVATPCPGYPHGFKHRGNFRGWDQLRHLAGG